MSVTTNTWSVNADGDWDMLADWSLGTIPDSNNNVVINTASIHTITHNSGADTVNSLSVGNDHFDLNGGTLALVAGASFALDYYQGGGTLTGAGTVAITGAGNLLGGGAQGTLAFQIGGTIQIAGYTLGGSATLTNNSTTNQTGQIAIGDATGVNAKITNAAAGTYTIAGDYGVSQGAASAIIVNAGTFSKSAGSGSSAVNVSVTNTGTISVASGMLSFNGPTNSFAGTISGAGQFAIGGGVSTIATGASITAGSFGIYNGAAVTLGGDLTYANSFTMAEASTINLNGHALTLSGAVSLYNNFGQPTINGAGALTTSGATSVNGFTLGGSVNWINKGAVTQNGNDVIGDGGTSGATFTNQAGASFNIANDTSLAHGSAQTSSFSNAGAFAKTAGNGTSNISVNFASTGTVSAATGTLYFQGSYDSFAGAISGAGAVTLGAGGVDTIAAGTAITVSSFSLRDSGTTVTLGGDLTYANAFTMAEGSALNLNGHALTLSGPVNLYNDFGQPTINGSGTLTTSATTSLSSFTLGGSVVWNNTGTITQTGTDQIGDAGTSAATFVNKLSAHFNIANDTNLAHGAAATSSFTNAGTFAKTAGNGTSFVDVNFVNTGTTSVATGTLEFRGPNDAFGGTISGAGAFTLGGGSLDVISAGASITVGAFSLHDSGTTAKLAGNLTYANAFTMGEATTVNLNGHALALTGAVNLFNNFGGPTINGSGALSTSGATSINGFTLGGSVTWTNKGTLTEIGALQIGDAGTSGATFANGVGATFNIANNAGVNVGAAATSVFNNAGAFVKTGGGGTSVVNVAFNNTGTVTANAGTIEFTNTVTGAGAYSVGANGYLYLGSSVSAGALSFSAAGGTLAIGDLAAFNGSISGFVAGDVLDLTGQAVATMSYTGTKLTVTLTNNTTKTLNFSSVVTALEAVSDGAGGADVIALPAPYALTTGKDFYAFASGTNTVTATAATLNAGDSLFGGTGVDKLALSGGGSFDLSALAALSFETVSVAAGSNYTLTAGDSDVAIGKQLAISAATLGSANSLNFNGSAATQGAFSIAGGAGADTIVGGGTMDTINGRGGNDMLTGGSGADTYVFTSALNGTTNDPTITNFHVSSDIIDLSHSIFTALTAGALPAADFTIGSGATTSSQHIIYNSGTGALLYDSDGSGAAAAVRFATLSTGLSLTAASFKVA